MQNLHDGKTRIPPTSESNGHHGGKNGDTHIDMKEEQTYSSQSDLKAAALNDTILKRIPVGAEATTVLVSSSYFRSDGDSGES